MYNVQCKEVERVIDDSELIEFCLHHFLCGLFIFLRGSGDHLATTNILGRHFVLILMIFIFFFHVCTILKMCDISFVF